MADTLLHKNVRSQYSSSGVAKLIHSDAVNKAGTYGGQASAVTSTQSS